LNERLFLGGDNTIRGYRVYRLGPQYNEGDPRGGMSLQLLSAEYCWTVNSRISTFLFCDSGHLSFDVWNFGTMWTSVGFGVNLKVFEHAPPITLGVGFPLNPDHKGDVKRFFFNLGGRF
jgi:outer membrane protein insertion porin family